MKRKPKKKPTKTTKLSPQKQKIISDIRHLTVLWHVSDKCADPKDEAMWAIFKPQVDRLSAKISLKVQELKSIK